MTPREELDLLLRVVSQLAQKQLETGGRMHFGAILGAGRNIKVLMPKSMKKGVTWDELIDYWKRELEAAASEMTWKAASSCTFASDVYLGENHSDRGFLIHPALVIHLEHSDEALGAECVAYPYEGSRGAKITLGEPTRTVAERWIPHVNTASHPEHGS